VKICSREPDVENKEIDLIPIGKVVKTRGVRGEVKAIVYSGVPDILVTREDVILEDRTGRRRRLKIIKARPHQKALLIQFEGFDSIDEAQEIVDGVLLIDRLSLGELQEGEFYWFEIIGMQVYDREGNYFGRIKNILQTGSNDVYISEDAGREYYIPAIKDVIVEISRSKNSILIDPLEGLFDND
jgi:16S rRNA processing protein RimM